METPMKPASESTTYQSSGGKSGMIPTTSPYFDKIKIDAINHLISHSPQEALTELDQYKDLIFEAQQLLYLTTPQLGFNEKEVETRYIQLNKLYLFFSGLASKIDYTKE